ncbi:CRISPR-associated endonuclease Cas2 [Natronospirillum operosum]|uniref:CRISPR-associated endoribonuclease Cas2 n=1 Tax=Natronospirillum operosum TaxID=2759953 RepID=A0A4Z0WBC0_9GAMM|nr:CRISPR-associated endonuclease Cas2 [Natronospirillum operosum]TGG95074.1 CRISPR-associated endonuclease Cas2 [Natronospirillum operosum]
MLVLVTYDVSVTSSEGRRRLRTIAKICLDYGMRVQNSVFECEVDPAQYAVLKDELMNVYDPEEDSLRFYVLGKKGRQRVEHYGSKPVEDPSTDPLII